MEYRRLGSTGLQVSEISLGSYLTFGHKLDLSSTKELMFHAFDKGINLYDTADSYADGRAEQLMATVFNQWHRGDFLVATKCFFPRSEMITNRGLSRKHIFDSLHNSLRNLRLDYVDLFQCHRFDPETPLEETIQALDELCLQGKILHWGVTRWSADQLRQAASFFPDGCHHRLASHQTVYSMAFREFEGDSLTALRELEIGGIIHSPLAQGVLTGKYSASQSPSDGRAASDDRQSMHHFDKETLERVAALNEIARDINAPTTQLALAWCLRFPEVTSVLIGSTTKSQIDENCGASGLRLSEETLRQIDAIFA